MNEIPAIPNPLANAKIVGTRINPDSYHRSTGDVRRGHPQRVMSRSELMTFANCPEKWLSGVGDDETSFTVWGSAVDCLALTPEQWNSRFVIRPETYPDAKSGDPKPWSGNSTWCKVWLAQHRDKIVLPLSPKRRDGDEGEVHRGALSPSKQEVDAAVAVLKSHRVAGRLIECSETQVFIVSEYHDAETGIVVPLKHLLDLAPDAAHEEFGKTLADLKTCQSAHPRIWTKACYDSGYDIQAAMNLDAYTAATGEDRTDFLHLCQENQFPYQVALWGLPAEWLASARLRYRSMLQSYCRCLKEQHWPGYPVETPVGCWGLLQPLPYMIS